MFDWIAWQLCSREATFEITTSAPCTNPSSTLVKCVNVRLINDLRHKTNVLDASLSLLTNDLWAEQFTQKANLKQHITEQHTGKGKRYKCGSCTGELNSTVVFMCVVVPLMSEYCIDSHLRQRQKAPSSYQGESSDSRQTPLYEMSRYIAIVIAPNCVH